MSKSRIWRKMLKKMQRKKRRQEEANERENKEKEEDNEKKENPNYQACLQTQAELEECHREFEKREHKMAEDAWLLREIEAQNIFQQECEKRKAEEVTREALKQQQLQQYEKEKAAKQEKLALTAQKLAEVNVAFESNMKLLEEYAENTKMSTPPALHEFIESRPHHMSCEFFDRTNCCRFGALSCCFNHRRPLLSRMLLLQHFFDHPLLHLDGQKNICASNQALNERDLRLAYYDFFNDVVPELEKYGEILNVRALRNSLPHLRGHVFVEYQQKRHALQAFMSLHGRFYGGKKLNVEFSHLTNWRTAVCGMCALWAA